MSENKIFGENQLTVAVGNLANIIKSSKDD